MEEEIKIPTAEEQPEDVQETKTEEPSELTEEQQQIAALQAQLEEEKDRYQRVVAEYANYKRRTDQEKDQLGAFVKGEVLKTLLPSIDNLERAVSSPDGEDYKKGVDMVIRQFEESLTAMGLEEIPALGQVFDPEVHHAVMREDADGVEPETVTEVYQKGYRLGTRVLRPAMVKVAN